MVVAKVLAKVSPIEHDNVIQTVPSDGTDQTFGERILRRRARCIDDFLDSRTLDPSFYRSTEGGGWDGEEIDRDKVRDMVFKEGPSRLRSGVVDETPDARAPIGGVTGIESKSFSVL